MLFSNSPTMKPFITNFTENDIELINVASHETIERLIEQSDYEDRRYFTDEYSNEYITLSDGEEYAVVVECYVDLIQDVWYGDYWHENEVEDTQVVGDIEVYLEDDYGNRRRAPVNVQELEQDFFYSDCCGTHTSPPDYSTREYEYD